MPKLIKDSSEFKEEFSEHEIEDDIVETIIRAARSVRQLRGRK